MKDIAAVRQAKEIVLARETPFLLAATQVRPAALETEHAGEVKSLEPRVMQVLVALARAAGQPVSRDELIESCWGGRIVTESALNRCVAQLRKVLGADAGLRLETIPTVGYRLQAKVVACQSGANDAVVGPSRVARSHGATLRIGFAAAAVMGTIVAVFVMLPRPAMWTAVAYHPLTSAPDFETYPALSPDGEQIVYASSPDSYGARDLYLRNVNQGTPVQITADENDDYGAAWSPAGDRVAFVRSYTQGPCAVLAVPVPRGPERVVARCQGASQTRPSWLDANTLVFSDQPHAGELSRIRAVDVETGVVRDLTSPPASSLGDAEPQSSPDGRYIAFRRSLTIGADDLFMLDVRSGEEHALTNDGWKAGGYVWSADSRNVFFSSNRGGEFGLWSVDRRNIRPPHRVSLGMGTVTFSRMTADRKNRLAVEVTRGRTILSRVLPSGEILPVTAGAGSDFDPAAAADGTLAYVSARNGAYEVWTTTPTGQSTQLTSIVGSYVTRPAWSPDGQAIAFVAVHDREAELYTVARDGSHLRQVTNDGIHKKDPVYVESGERVLYVERREGRWRLMEMSLAVATAQPRAVPAGHGWNTLRSGPDGTLFGQRQGESTLRVLSVRALDSGGSAASGIPVAEDYRSLTANGPSIADIDVWAAGPQGIYVRRGRRVQEPSSIWLYPGVSPAASWRTRRSPPAPWVSTRTGRSSFPKPWISRSIWAWWNSPAARDSEPLRSRPRHVPCYPRVARFGGQL